MNYNLICLSKDETEFLKSLPNTCEDGGMAEKLVKDGLIVPHPVDPEFDEYGNQTGYSTDGTYLLSETGRNFLVFNEKEWEHRSHELALAYVQGVSNRLKTWTAEGFLNEYKNAYLHFRNDYGMNEKTFDTKTNR